MEHWNSFEESNGTIEFADMEQWTTQLREVEKSIDGIKHNTKDKHIIYQDAVIQLTNLFYKLIQKIKTTLISQKNINNLYELLDKIESVVEKHRKEKRDTLEKIEFFRRTINMYSNNLDFLFEKAIYNINNNVAQDDIISIIHILVGTNLCTYSDIPLLNDYYYQTNSSDCQSISVEILGDVENTIKIKTIIKKWIYLCKLFKDNDTINEYDRELFLKYKTFNDGCKKWKLLHDEIYNMISTKKTLIDLNLLINKLRSLSNNLYDNIYEKKVVASYNDGLFLLLNKVEAFLQENKLITQEANNVINDLIFKCIVYDQAKDQEIRLNDNSFNNQKVYSIKKWIEIPHINLINKTINLNTFIKYRYIDQLKLKFTDCPNKLNTKLCEINDLKKLINELEKNVKQSINKNYYCDYKLFSKNEYRKIISLLNIFLDGDIDFIKENGKFYFSIECLIQLNDFLDNPDDDEFIEEFKNKNIDYIMKNDEDNIYLTQFHRIINDLYFNKPLQSEIDTECTIELLMHKVYNNLKNSFKYFKLNVNTKYVAEKDIFTYIGILKEIFFENTPYKNFDIYDDLIDKYKKHKNYKVTLDNIGKFIHEVKKPYNQILINNYKDLMYHYQYAAETLNGFNKIIINKLQK